MHCPFEMSDNRLDWFHVGVLVHPNCDAARLLIHGCGNTQAREHEVAHHLCPSRDGAAPAKLKHHHSRGGAAKQEVFDVDGDQKY